MKRGISLYIQEQRVDIGEDNLILFNYTQEDLDNPTIVKNSYSQQITLKGTPANNKVFSSAFRLDKTADSGFNPRVKSDFVIIDELGEILQRGYVKLDSISRDTEVEYKVTLYGVLGSILYDMSYNDDGEKRTLADLDYLGTQEPDTEFDYTINRTFLRNSWDVLSGALQNPLGEVLNFAPCYNGKPSGFSADKAVIDGHYVGINGRTFKATLSREYTEQETHDLRSYLQRPVLRVKAVFDGLRRFTEARGWTFDIDQDLMSEDIMKDTWMTLPLLDIKSETNLRSNVPFTKKDILANTPTPAEFLLSFCKMCGLKLWADPKTQTIHIMSRGSFFTGTITDISKRINLGKKRSITPLLISSKWYQMESEDSGEFATKYNSMYGRNYGLQRINTGYQFNSDIKTITDNISFKGGVQSLEFSNMFLDVYNGDGEMIPAPFIEGGTYTFSVIGTTTEEERSLTPASYRYSWFNQTNKGYDFVDLVQLHGEDNKEIDGSGVLLYFDGMVSCPESYFVSDDIPDLMVKPCWNFTDTNRIGLVQIPHFTRFRMADGQVTGTLDWGESFEINIPGVSYAEPYMGIYADRWRSYLIDRYNENTKMVSLHVNLQGMDVGVDLMRRFYWFDNCVWSLNKINNHSLTSWDDTECEFVQVQDITNYK